VIRRFCLYSVLKNLRFADPFLVLFLLDVELSLTQIGVALGAQHLLTGALEVPLGVAADRFGRRRALAAGFVSYALAFSAFAQVGRGTWGLLAAALGAFGVAEALRTGSHKAIMLDHLARRGESERATEVIGLTRSFSKFSSGSAALAGGVLLWASQSYALLFILSAVSAAGGFVLMLSYPAELEGEQRRARAGDAPRLSWSERWHGLADRSVAASIGESTLFESQSKIALKYYLQPFLKQGLAGIGLPILAGGAIAVGAIELLRDAIGGLGARFAPALERRSRGAERALRLAYGAALAALLGIALCASVGWLWVGVALAIGLTLLQNARRPVFVRAFEQRIDPAQRATGLSVESLTRTVTVAALLPIVGVLADRVGLWAAFALMAAVLASGLLIPNLSRRAHPEAGV
jgi:MFS family permease